jgi:two-component system sensor histidine kinase/response regulator
MRRRLRRFIGRLRHCEQSEAYFQLLSAEGHDTLCRAAATLLGTEAGDGRQILWLLADVSAVREARDQAEQACGRLEAELAQRSAELDNALAQLDEATAHKDRFLAMMSHELRTPLTVLVGGARILHSRLENVPSDDRRELLSDMLIHGQRLQHLIENLMVLARGQNVELENFSLRRLLPNIVFGYQFADPGLSVRIHVPDDLPDVRGSTLGIEQVMRNVLTNTRLHGRSEEPVEISARRVGRYVTVSLRDHGRGIDASELKRVFDPYTHAKPWLRDATATGIGLAVSKRLMEAQQGGIWARQPNDGRGAVITFALPLAEAPRPAAVRRTTR